MSTDPLTFLRDTFPSLFNRGVELLDARAADGDERATATLSDVRAARGAVCVDIEGEGRIYLCFSEGTCVTADSAPDGLKVRFAIGAAADATRALLAEVEGTGRLGEDRAAIRAASTANGRVEPLIDQHSLRFHVVLTDVPDLGDVTVRVGVGVAEPPDDPGFTATVRFDDLEDIRDSGQNLQQLFMGGKVRLSGDYSPALQLGMQLMQLAK